MQFFWDAKTLSSHHSPVCDQKAVIPHPVCADEKGGDLHWYRGGGGWELNNIWLGLYNNVVTRPIIVVIYGYNTNNSGFLIPKKVVIYAD